MAKRTHIGMMDIIDHLGKSSGIDDAVYNATDTGTAQKIISLARYLLATNGQSLPGIQTWQYNHPIPYVEGMTEETFVSLGTDETLRQKFFGSRCRLLSEIDALAYDSSSVPDFKWFHFLLKLCREHLKSLK